MAAKWLIFVFCAIQMKNSHQQFQLPFMKKADELGNLAGIDPKNIKFYLYTSPNKDQEKELVTGQLETLKASNFNKDKPTKIIIHGFLADHNKEPMQALKNAYLDDRDDNVIIVDYKPYSSSYTFAVNNAKAIAEVIARFIEFLIDQGDMKESNLHIIGHSLGAHIGGFVGQNLPFTVPRITGLDPAGPLFSGKEANKRLSADDAEFVDCIHSSKMLGIHDNICTVNYFVNGGSNQPRCSGKGAVQHVVGQCDHMESIWFFAESIRKKRFTARSCRSVKEATSKKCSEGNFKMGDQANKSNVPLGIYFVSTTKK